jgi:hypothetical protein
MDTVIIQLKNKKAFKLLEDMEELDLIKVIKQTPNISSLRELIKTPMNNEEIDAQLKEIREEWHRDF